MSFLPKKPHFLKPILPGFKKGIKIPKSFLKYLKGHDHEHGILRSKGKKWQVKRNGCRFGAGWGKFAEDHDLREGNILVFRHEGDMEFDVTIFDAFAEHQQEEEEEEDLEVPTKIVSPDKASPNVEAAKSMPLGHTQFTCTMKAGYLKNSFLPVPNSFAWENDLSNKKCIMTISDEQRSWEFSLYSCGKTTYIGGGWHDFCQANFLKEGDPVRFEIVTCGEMPVLKFHDVRGTPSLQPRGKKTNLDSKRDANQEKPMPNKKSSHKALPNVDDCRCCICTMKPYFLTNCFVRLPRKFARVNNLDNRNCNIMVTTQQRSWTFSLHSSSGHTYISGGWRQFCIANCLEIGDYLMFEMVADGETPTLKFHDLRGNAPVQPEGKKANLNAESVSAQGLEIETSDMPAPKAQVPASTSANANPHFVSTIPPYAAIRQHLYLPLAFAKSNGLVNRRCEMILIDEQQRTWSVQLKPMEHHVGINKGWNRFRKANDVQAGDTYKFELINNETTPVVYFHCKYAGKDAAGIREALDKVLEQLAMGKDLRGNALLQRESRETNLDAETVSTRDLIGDASLQPEGKKTNVDVESVSTQALVIKTSNVTTPKAVQSSPAAYANPRFISTIQPYSISRRCLYLPNAFAKSNGLVNRCCKMILIDEQQRSWSVQLRPMSPHVGISSGWNLFIIANNVQVGDTYKFELINNETLPVAYVHCKYAGKDAPGIREAIDKIMKEMVMDKAKEDH